MSTSYNNCMYTTVPDEDIPVMFDFSEQELLNDGMKITSGNSQRKKQGKKKHFK